MNTEEFGRTLADLEVRLERLRSLYEQYFIGIERLEPGVARKDVDRRFWELRKVRVRNTALRFRFQTLVQRYNTLQQYWVRICRQIESGTYSRHVRRAAQLSAANPGPEETFSESQDAAESERAPAAFDLGQMLAEELADDNALASAIDAALAAVNPVRGAAPRASAAPANEANATRARPPPPPRRSAAGLSNERIRDLHVELSRARNDLKQGNVSSESVEKKVRAAEADLRAKHPGKAVDFRVEVKDGKAIIKPFLR